MTIVWRDQMSVGNHLVDIDHRLLICMINSVEFALQSPGDEMVRLEFSLDELEEYTDVHFDREERLQLKIGYAGYGDHKLLHRSLVDRLKEIRLSILKIGDPLQLGRESPRLAELLRDWLLVHVLLEDMKMKTVFLKHPFNLAP
ncbi:MAG: hemerythrin family protein [Candidatus Thiodiazotropha sp. (ex Dulcina madagascariensis)]|nr:hemerythrin family protein [Candidatus Thiodiazotropha sp. (ex Dulcina madagascariensis)]MCU7926659.1 hemerythrin family protein [Candidatus Thiodiazotropha sp. (ex Dulcina madagascariensis)]